jgi:hypothetical protein
MLRLVPVLLAISVLTGCSAAIGERPAGTSDVACISRFYDPPGRSMNFPEAVGACAGRRPADLTGNRYYQLLASSFNLPFVSHDQPGSDVILLTGSRIPVPTNVPPPPELSFN